MTRPKLRRIDSPHGRAYALQKENTEIVFLPSVTTILSLMPSTHLAELEKEIGKDALKEIGEKAALRGTAMHEFIENYLICIKQKGNPDTCLLYTQRKSTDNLLYNMEKDRINEGRSLFYNLYHSDIFNRIKRIIYTEQFLYSVKYLFAGTVDLTYVNTNNHIIITDFKSASRERDGEVLEKYKCQIAAYAIAFEEMYNKPIKGGEIWLSHPDGLQIVDISHEELETKKIEFIKLCEVYHSMWDTEPFKELFYKDI